MGEGQAARLCGSITSDHAWAATGVWDAEQGQRVMRVPCKRKGCGAQLVRFVEGGYVTPDGHRTPSQWAFVPTGFGMTINGIELNIEDDPEGGVAKIIAHEIRKDYGLRQLGLKADDVVIDIGAHVGVVSIYLAKQFPGIRVYAFEPWHENYMRLVRNAEANGVFVNKFKYAVTADGREIELYGNPGQNSGGISAFVSEGGYTQWVPSFTLPAIFEKIGTDRVALLKIDCEGAEYEILEAAGPLLERAGYLRGEFHVNKRLAEMGHSPDGLIDFCARYIPRENITVTKCRIGD